MRWDFFSDRVEGLARRLYNSRTTRRHRAAACPDLEYRESERVESRCGWLDECAGRSNPVKSTSLIVWLDDERDGRGW